MVLSLRYGALVASLVAAATALNGIVVPTTIAADTSFNATFQDPGSDDYRVFLSAAVTGSNGPMCYLVNSTSLTSPVNLTIPAEVGPDATYYSIGIRDVTTDQGATYSNRFNFTGGTGQATEYEDHLDGAPFWDADDLPCTAMSCARACANASYPEDLTETSAYDTMRTCILACPGVVADSASSLATNASVTAKTVTASAAFITVASGVVLTAVETIVTTGGSTKTEAVIGTQTIDFGSVATISSDVISYGSKGLEVEGTGTTTVAFSDVVETTTATVTAGTSSSASAASGSSSATSTGAAARETGFALAAGAAGLAAFFL